MTEQQQYDLDMKKFSLDLEKTKHKLDSENKFWLYFWLIICSTLVVLVLGIFRAINGHEEKMASLGYQKQEVVSTYTSTSTEWQKAD